MILIGAAALIFFGPDQLPKVAKRAGQVVREVQNTSQSFIREMERAADDVERRERYAAEAAAAAPPVHAESPASVTHEPGLDLGPLHAHATGEVGAPDLSEVYAHDPIEIIEAGAEPAPAKPTAPHPQSFEI
jgi:Sec-independent protein translocase protein TatA